MDTVVAEIEQRLEAYSDPIEVAVLGCAVNGIGEASHADFGITGARNEGLIFAHGEPLRKVKQESSGRRAVRGDRQVGRARGRVEVDEHEAAVGAEWLAKIEEENAGELTPERIAQMEKEAAKAQGKDVTAEPLLKPVKRPALDEEASPTPPALHSSLGRSTSEWFRRPARTAGPCS